MATLVTMNTETEKNPKRTNKEILVWKVMIYCPFSTLLRTAEVWKDEVWIVEMWNWNFNGYKYIYKCSVSNINHVFYMIEAKYVVHDNYSKNVIENQKISIGATWFLSNVNPFHIVHVVKVKMWIFIQMLMVNILCGWNIEVTLNYWNYRER